jgi:hypothetical protein
MLMFLGLLVMLLLCLLLLLLLLLYLLLQCLLLRCLLFLLRLLLLLLFRLMGVAEGEGTAIPEGLDGLLGGAGRVGGSCCVVADGTRGDGGLGDGGLCSLVVVAVVDVGLGGLGLGLGRRGARRGRGTRALDPGDTVKKVDELLEFRQFDVEGLATADINIGRGRSQELVVELSASRGHLLTGGVSHGYHVTFDAARVVAGERSFGRAVGFRVVECGIQLRVAEGEVFLLMAVQYGWRHAR